MAGSSTWPLLTTLRKAPSTPGNVPTSTRTQPTETSFYTALPTLGQVIQQGQPVYSVDGRSMPLFYGPVMAWRVFSAGMDDGPDVGQLNQNLIALGFGRG